VISSAIIIWILGIYRLCISPLFPSRCRFLPSCSQYMIDAVRSRGAARGVWLGILRILRCNPLFSGGYDPAPEK